ncbi:MAG: hypothetical protein HY864_15840 [Chloroflexi bacterium]|nr:hypothetical protein [Chloroflexota bacterium]
MTNIALTISIMLGTGLIARGWNLAGLDNFALWFIALGIIWLIAQYNHWGWFSAAALLAVILAACAGLWLGLHAGWLIAGSIFSLIAWDLTDFRHKKLTLPKHDLRGIEQRHIARLSFLALAGLIFATLLLLLRRQFTSDWGILLGVMAVNSFTQFIFGLRVK